MRLAPGVAVVLLSHATALAVSAQVLCSSDGPIEPSAGGEPEIVLCGATGLSQSTDTATVTAFNSVACNVAGLHTDNSYWRKFAPAELPADGLAICSVDFGIEVANAAGEGTTQPLDLRLYEAPAGTFPTVGALTLLGTATVAVADQSLTHLQLPIDAVLSPGAELVVEIHTPDGIAAGNSFFVGSNAAGQSAPSYISAAECGVLAPTDLALLGFPGVHLVETVRGTVCPSTCGTVSRTRSTDPCTVSSGNSVACIGGGFHAASSYWRVVSASQLPASGIEVCGVTIGIELAGATGDASQAATVRIYEGADGSFPAGGPGTLVGGTTLEVADPALSRLWIPVSGRVPAGRELVVELFTPEGFTDGNAFFVGSNAAGQASPSYISAADCGIASPTDLAAIGFPAMHIVESVGGRPLLDFRGDCETVAMCNWSALVGPATCL
jgi:hypothetical protein